jgi:hypothetical protein
MLDSLFSLLSSTLFDSIKISFISPNIIEPALVRKASEFAPEENLFHNVLWFYTVINILMKGT